MMIICLVSNYKYYTVSLQMRLIDEQLILPVYQSFRHLLPKRCPKRKRVREKNLYHNPPGENHQQLSHSFKKEPIIAIWQLCSFLNRSCFKGADLAFCLGLRTLFLFCQTNQKAVTTIKIRGKSKVLRKSFSFTGNDIYSTTPKPVRNTSTEYYCLSLV